MSNTYTQPVDPADLWVTVSGPKYDPLKFYMKSTDGHGHAALTQTRMSPALHGEIGALIATRKVPYKTIADFVRDACFHRARYLADQLKLNNLRSVTDSDLLLQRFAEEEAFDKQQRAIVEYIERNLRAATEDQYWERVETLLDDAFTILSADNEVADHDMPDFYRAKLGDVYDKYLKVMRINRETGRNLKAV